MAYDSVLERSMFQPKDKSPKAKGIAAISEGDTADKGDLELRRQKAAEMLAQAKQEQDPANFQTLAENERPMVFRPTAVNLPPPQQQPPVAQQMAQMQAAGMRPVGMAHGGLASFAKGGFNNVNLGGGIEGGGDTDLADGPLSSDLLSDQEKLDAQRKLSDVQGIGSLKETTKEAPMRSTVKDETKTSAPEDMPSYRDSWIANEKAKDQAKWQAAQEKLGVGKGGYTSPLDWMRFGPRSDAQLQEEFYQKDRAEKSAGMSTEKAVENIQGITAAGREAAGTSLEVPDALKRDQNARVPGTRQDIPTGIETISPPKAAEETPAAPELRSATGTPQASLDAAEAATPVTSATGTPQASLDALNAKPQVVGGVPGAAVSGATTPVTQAGTVGGIPGAAAATGTPEPAKYSPSTTMAEIKADREKARQDNINMSLIEAGLQMAAGKSSNALTNIGEGGAAGIRAFAGREAEGQKLYREDIRSIRDENRAAQEMAQRERMQGEALSASARQAELQRGATAELAAAQRAQTESQFGRELTLKQQGEERLNRALTQDINTTAAKLGISRDELQNQRDRLAQEASQFSKTLDLKKDEYKNNIEVALAKRDESMMSDLQKNISTDLTTIENNKTRLQGNMTAGMMNPEDYKASMNRFNQQEMALSNQLTALRSNMSDRLKVSLPIPYISSAQDPLGLRTQ